jgi:hypothetical protein
MPLDELAATMLFWFALGAMAWVILEVVLKR